MLVQSTRVRSTRSPARSPRGVLASISASRPGWCGNTRAAAEGEELWVGSALCLWVGSALCR
eukprot:12004910-Alexandrium_andersonii.AAC.1